MMWMLLRLHISASPISIVINGLSGLLITSEHGGKPTPALELTTEMRYKGTSPPPDTSNVHGEIEYLNGDTPVIHWYEEANGCTYHFVTAGDPSKEVILIVPGLPESWWAFHNQIEDLSTDYYVIAVDPKGYGQSDKRLHLDYTNQAMAEDLAVLMEKLKIEEFNMMGHDRGTVLADNLTHVPSMKGRILRYVRMQQSFNEPHGKPVPPHFLMATIVGEAFFKSRNFVSIIYNGWFPANVSESTIRRLKHEFSFRGTAAAMRKYFKTTSFDIELADRHNFLFESMTMPMLLLQAMYDDGQHCEEYDRSPDHVANARVQFICASHFFHIEAPVATNRAIRRFLSEPRS